MADPAYDVRDQVEELVAENARLRFAAVSVRAVLRGMLSDENVTRSIDLTPEIEMLTEALGDA